MIDVVKFMRLRIVLAGLTIGLIIVGVVTGFWIGLIVPAVLWLIWGVVYKYIKQIYN